MQINRRRRIERIKKFIRFLLFLKHHYKQIIIAGCLLFSLSFAGCSWKKENVYAALPMKETEQMDLSYMNKSENPQYDDRQSEEYPDAENTALADGFDDEVTETSGESEKYATSHIEGFPDALSEQAIEPTDIYAEKDSVAVFHCFYPGAEQYTWEIYDKSEGWVEIPAETSELLAYDELYREVSSLCVPASADADELMIRCITDFKAKESITNTAKLYVLDKEIMSVSVAEDFKSDFGEYISAKDIPVCVTYQDGSQEEMTGLNNLCFLKTAESSEYSTSEAGNPVETVTIVNTSCEYYLVDLEESETTLRYHAGGTDEPIDASIKMIGEDLSAPVISRLTISEFEISNVDQPVPVTVTIQAEDKNTPYPDLEYAFLPDGQDPGEDDWYNESSFDVDITQNGKWIAYCRDKSGNITTSEKDIIVVDNKAPVVSISLEHDSWCPENKILVKATDKLSMEYCFSNAETGEDSGWITRREYSVMQNGTWKVKVRDAAGNITEQEITIDNIDSQKPVINQINEKK